VPRILVGCVIQGKVPSGNVESLEGWLLRLDNIAFGVNVEVCVLISTFNPGGVLEGVCSSAACVCVCEDQFWVGTTPSPGMIFHYFANFMRVCFPALTTIVGQSIIRLSQVHDAFKAIHVL